MFLWALAIDRALLGDETGKEAECVLMGVLDERVKGRLSAEALQYRRRRQRDSALGDREATNKGLTHS